MLYIHCVSSSSGKHSNGKHCISRDQTPFIFKQHAFPRSLLCFWRLVPTHQVGWQEAVPGCFQQLEKMPSLQWHYCWQLGSDPLSLQDGCQTDQDCSQSCNVYIPSDCKQTEMWVSYNRVQMINGGLPIYRVVL